jgi:hypothetical protein
VVERTAHNQYLASNATENLSNLSTRIKSKAIPTADKLPYTDKRVIKLYFDREQSLRFYKSPYGNSIEEFKAVTSLSILELGNLKIDLGKIPQDLLSQLAHYASS